MKKITKKQLLEYDKRVKDKLDKFKLSSDDVHNLYDMMYMVNWTDYDTLKLNKMSKWFRKFFYKLEKIIE